MRHSSMSESRNIVLPFFFFLQWPHWEHSNWHPQCSPKQICTFFLQSSLVCNRNAPYSVEADMAMGQDTLLHWGNLACYSHDWFGLHHPSTLHLERQQHLLWPYTSHKKYEVCCSSSTSKSFWQPVAGKEMFSFILKQLTAYEALKKSKALWFLVLLW